MKSFTLQENNLTENKEDQAMYSNSGSRKWSNEEGYSDPTAGTVIDKLDRENPPVTRTLHETNVDLVKLARAWSMKR